MRPAIEKRDILGGLVICGLAILLSISAHDAIKSAFNSQIVRDAEHTARAWAEFLSGHAEDIEAIVAGETPSTQSLRFIEMARSVGDVKRFKLFDHNGVLRFASDEPFVADNPSPKLQVRNPAAAAVVKSGLPFTEVRRIGAEEQTSLFAQTYLPITRKGRTVAIAEVYVDQTAKQRIFAESFFIAMLFTPLLIAGGFGIPAVAYYVRSRQVGRIESDTTDTNRKLTAVLENMSQGFCMFDADQRLVLANDQYLSLYNLPPEMGIPGVTVRESLECRVANGVFGGGDPEVYMEERLDCVAAGEYRRSIQEMPDGRVVAVTHKPLPDGGWLTTHDDVTALQRIERRISYLAHHDAVTGLPNRTSFCSTLTSELSGGASVAVLCLDLDHFKNVNDTLGHPVGDHLLQEVARRLKDCVGDTSTVARLGGDEFAVVRPGHVRREETAGVANRICDALREPFDLDDHQVMISTSIGIAVSPKHGTTCEELLKNADLALYEAKSERRGAFRYFEVAMAERMKARRQMEIDLRIALRGNQFELKYQPLIDARTNAVSGFEALLRWHHPELGCLAPSDFIALTEEIGLIVPIGEWVIREACAEAAKWPDNIQISVNVSAPQFRSGKLVPMVINALSTSGISPSRLEIEITEAILTQYNEETLRTLQMLRNLGVRISMDDFGTGSSSLSYLRSFPFDKLKIHRSFVGELGNRDDARPIIRTIAELGRSLGMTTTAEGVETQEQLASVQAEGYTEIQGFLYSQPLDAGEVLARYFPQRLKSAEVA